LSLFFPSILPSNLWFETCISILFSSPKAKVRFTAWWISQIEDSFSQSSRRFPWHPIRILSRSHLEAEDITKLYNLIVDWAFFSIFSVTRSFFVIRFVVGQYFISEIYIRTRRVVQEWSTPEQINQNQITKEKVYKQITQKYMKHKPSYLP
jgi:hypothetical protein